MTGATMRMPWRSERWYSHCRGERGGRGVRLSCNVLDVCRHFYTLSDYLEILYLSDYIL
ncbi:hypothetical protein [Common midwife toad virus]|uniref:Uncharacterized protein n=2 Tax=Common midwife toad virus TaxID=540070 RepID=A0A2D0XJG5_9VIRU|nr:hypothetical protein D1U33_gp099 [Common midwife toad virus]AIW68590.1 hypothetical protein [common midwife toad virus-NL]ASH97779.1 hypothetical protein [Common midwife toad virus]ASH97827.1 hypothetical protein [Common midwife toad virus]ASH97987.1 hypothetical protein [Common midwife toad virus]ASH98089.1 hypothetical protein [Common midwife toad virus]